MSTVQLGTITTDEVRVLGAAVNSIDLTERNGEAMHLRVHPTGRQWIIQSSLGQLVLDVSDPDAQTDDLPWLPLSERVRRFADCFDDEPVRLSLVDHDTVVAEAGGVSAAIDLVVPQQPMPEPWNFLRSASATVPYQKFLGLLWSARCLPSGGVGDSKYPMPTMWMQIGDGWLGLHVNWNDFLPSRATYRIDATGHDGTTTAAVPHHTIESFLRYAWPYRAFDDDSDDDLQLTISVGTVLLDDGERDALRLSAQHWTLTTWLVDPLVERWGEQIDDALRAAELAVIEEGDGDWLVNTDGPAVRVKLHHGSPDVARVSALLVAQAEESIELLRELGSLNAASTGIRFWLEDGVVRAAADVRCTSLNTLADVVRDVSRSATNYAPMLAALGVTA